MVGLSFLELYDLSSFIVNMSFIFLSKAIVLGMSQNIPTKVPLNKNS